MPARKNGSSAPPVFRTGTVSERSLILGLGRTGLSCIRYLTGLGHEVAVTDSRPIPPGLELVQQTHRNIPVAVAGFDVDMLDRADQLIVSPGISSREPIIREALERGLPVFSDIELFARSVNAPVVAITGSNGKSTVTTLIAEMIRRSGRRAEAGGNLGRPALDLLAEPVPDFYVLELSSFQLERTFSLQTVTAVVTNVSPDHMDRYASVEEYSAAKARVYEGCARPVVNLDDARVRAMIGAARESLGFGLTPSAHFGLVESRDGGAYLARDGQPLLAMDAMRIAGRHNASNALAALALAEALSLPIDVTVPVLESFQGLAHRTQRITERDGVIFIDDSKATNVGAAVAAISGLAGPLVLIAGGDGKGADFEPLVQACAGKVRAVVLLGRDASVLERALRGHCETYRVTDMEAAVTTAAGLARPGESVLLSPACSSQDMFKDFEERGDVFAHAVKGLRS